MSMIIICQSNFDLSRYGLKNAYTVGMMHLKEIARIFRLNNDKLWSNDVFGCLYDESSNYLLNYNKNGNFSDTSVFYFLNEILEKCDKIAVFYCEPSADISTWKFCKSKERFLHEFEIILRTDDIAHTLVFEKLD